MQSRVYLSKLRAGCEKDYIEAHKAVWPTLLEAMKHAGVIRESCFVVDRFVVVHIEAVDVDSTLARLAECPISQQWEERMAALLERPTDSSAELEQNSSYSAQAESVQGGFLLRKKPLESSDSGYIYSDSAVFAKMTEVFKMGETS